MPSDGVHLDSAFARELLERQDRLQTEAWRTLDALDLAAALASIGPMEVIGSLASDEPARMRVADATGQLARKIFDMKHYVEWLDSLGIGISARGAQQRADAETLRSQPRP